MYGVGVGKGGGGKWAALAWGGVGVRVGLQIL